MKTVRQWEYTSRFGPVGNGQTSQANNARVVDYFSDCYEEPKEALYKAEVFLSIYDYLGRHAAMFARKKLLEEVNDRVFSVETGLLRALHFAFTSALRPASVDPKKIASLARSFADIA
jgi:hypothetical protein